MGGTVNMGGKVLYTVIHLYNSCTQYSTSRGEELEMYGLAHISKR